MSTIKERFQHILRGDSASGRGPVQAVWNGTVIAQSDRTVVVEGNHYFPPEDIKSDYLSPSEHSSTCPWKGTARYYDLVVDGERNRDAGWSYPSPKSAAAQIKDHVAFWHGVTIRPAVQP